MDEFHTTQVPVKIRTSGRSINGHQCRSLAVGGGRRKEQKGELNSERRLSSRRYVRGEDGPAEGEHTGEEQSN